jgi:hypothetical protein
MLLRWMVPGTAPAAWIMGSVVALIVIIIAGVMLERRAAPALSQALGEDADRSRDEALRAGNGLLMSLWIRVPIGIAILALMPMKPGTSGPVAVLSAGFAAGIAVVLVAYRRSPVPGGAAARS